MSELPPSTVPSPPVPGALWALGWVFAAEGVLQLAVRGPKDDAVSLVGSVLLGLLVVLFFSVGVVRARGVRTAVVAVVLAVAVVAGVVGLVSEPTVLGLVTLGFSAVEGWLLWRFTSTTWWDWQRTRPAGGRAPGAVLALAALVGVLGGVTASPVGGNQVDVSLHVSF